MLHRHLQQREASLLWFVSIKVKANVKAMSFANYCIVPGCVSETKAMFQRQRSKKIIAFAFGVRFNIKEPLSVEYHSNSALINQLNCRICHRDRKNINYIFQSPSLSG